ncbi:N-acetylmuramoyl-L-alanine amidase [Salinicoccus sp. ID82-1]|uniref:N-acetylmuramoyl-L-alanine amidase n=1 Tax=Salinicoccus cyprini TaxID=2493691 RepID=A0A558AYJ7_9STAP|nr:MULTISPECIES: N-acetylmuramoyl-L-alanine amidase [Salinicoccus]MCG1008867.1 N-acetylmuramoyl-L-alanine amidase [Salinicoccus sp. ID82-1]TVT29330.1 N-acetylmuramoyl-L-alanine amidase [Salinicoccus cyprini]
MGQSDRRSIGIVQHIRNFFKYKKHLYMAPLCFMLLAGGIILASVLLFDRFLNETHEPIQVNLDAPDYDFSGQTIVIDPGHGGKDPGATSISGVTEDQIVFGIAKTLEARLASSGAEVILTRDRDTFASLDERKVEGDLFISLHSDAMDDPSISGFTTYYTHPGQKAFAESINAALDQYSYFYNRGVETMNYQVTWQLDYPAVLVELGYLSNEVDDMSLTETRYQNMMAAGILEGIDDYLN